jgi:hypothetical protein
MTPCVDSRRKVSLPQYLADMLFHTRLPSRSVMISQVMGKDPNSPCEFQEACKT